MVKTHRVTKYPPTKKRGDIREYTPVIFPYFQTLCPTRKTLRLKFDLRLGSVVRGVFFCIDKIVSENTEK